MESIAPHNPLGKRTLIVDAGDQRYYPRPSLALEDAREDDQIYIPSVSTRTRSSSANGPFSSLERGGST